MATKTDTYITRKLNHIARFGNAAGTGMNGGAAPQWLIDQQVADEKRRAADHKRRQDAKERRQDIDWD